jgi:hypothetical protein
VVVRDALLRLLVEHLRDPEPSLRLDAARAILGQRYPSAESIAGQVALDPNPGVRHGVLAILRQAGDPAAWEPARHMAADVDLLFDGLTGPGGAREQWLLALDRVARLASTWVEDLLIALLRELPAGAEDPWPRLAVAAIDAAVTSRGASGGDLLSVCRRLIEPPRPAPEHAARLAGTLAAGDPRALDFLWLLYTRSRGPGSAAARGALAAIAPQPKTPAVEAELARLRAETGDPQDRALLGRLLGYPS